MARWKLRDSVWTIVVIVAIFSPIVMTRPSDDIVQDSTTSEKKTLGNVTKLSDIPSRYNNKEPIHYVVLNKTYSTRFHTYIGNLNDRNKFFIHYNDSLKRTASDLIPAIGSVKNHKLQFRSQGRNKAHFSRISRLNPYNNIPLNLLKSDENRENTTNKYEMTNTRSIKISPELRNQRKKTLKWKTRINPSKDKLNTTEETALKLKEQRDRRPVIRKVYTKWTDRTRFEATGIDKSSSTPMYDLGPDSITFENSIQSVEDIDNHNLYLSTESSEVDSVIQNTPIETKHKVIRPIYPYSDETHVYSSNIHVLDTKHTRRPIQFNKPSPTPIVTNSGTPKPWNLYQQQIHNPQTPSSIVQRPTYLKPANMNKPSGNLNNYGNHIFATPVSFTNYPYRPNQFDVTTTEPAITYTEKIVIRPEEYNASSDDCPTIYLTLNNTFQEAQGKEACPDLNIAVNTNVVNKNIVVSQSEEDEPDYINGPFGIPLEEDSESAETSINENEESSENAAEEIEDSSEDYEQFEAYNAVGAEEFNEGGSSPGTGIVSPSAGYQSFTRPIRPPKNKDEDDFGLGSFNDWVKPAVNIMSWFSAFNPFNFGIISLILTPLALMLAGTSGVAALFAPWALPYARQSPPKIVHVYRPQWKWNEEDHAWSYHSFPNNRKFTYEDRRSKEIAYEDYKLQTQIAEKVKSWIYNSIYKTFKYFRENIIGLQRLRKKRKRLSGYTPIK